jgi:hypothetical protein
MAKTEDTMIAALLREREGMVQLGREDRVALIDEQLTLRGYVPESEPKAPAKKAAAKKTAAAPNARQAPAPETT